MLELKKYANCLVLAPKKPNAPALKKFPAAVYSVMEAENGDIVMIERVKQYTLPEKIYGISHKRNLRILGQQYEERVAKGLNTGAMITGFKGSGKTLLAEAVANEMISRERPVFYIDKQLPVDTLITLAKYAAPCMFLFDEFEKVYSVSEKDDDEVDRKVQNKLLTFFSSTEFGGVLSTLVSNSNLSSLLTDRPQRMLLNFSYNAKTRDRDFEVAMDEVGFTPYLKAMFLLGSGDGSRNIDCLLAVADVVNKHYDPEDPTSGQRVQELLEVMNVSLRAPRKFKIIVEKFTDRSKLGFMINATYDTVNYETGVNITIVKPDGKVVFEKRMVIDRGMTVRVEGLVFVIAFGETLPFNADLAQGATRLTLDETHLELLNELGGDSVSKVDNGDNLVELIPSSPALSQAPRLGAYQPVNQLTESFFPNNRAITQSIERHFAK